jgi:hypothetical protein
MMWRRFETHYVHVKAEPCIGEVRDVCRDKYGIDLGEEVFDSRMCFELNKPPFE